jgi:RHS repeat-associated protein
MPGRHYDAGLGYRYGFNGKEKDNEVKGEGNQQDYGMRVYDPRLGKFLAVDPLTSSYPFYSPYHFAGNNPIAFIDLDGAEPSEPGKEKGETQTGTNGGSDEAKSWKWDGKSWKENEMEGVVVTGKKPKEGSTRTGEKWEGSGSTGGGGGSVSSVTQYYHKGSRQYNTKGGWYEFDDYVKVLRSRGLGTDMSEAARMSLVVIPIPGFDDRINTFFKEIGEPTEAFYTAMTQAAWEGAASRNMSTSGYIEQSNFNVEDMVGIGMMLKGAIKALSVTAMYRNFGDNEMASLLKNNKFTMGSNMIEKQFWLDRESLDWWKSTDFAKRYSVKITVPKSSLRLGYKFVDAGKGKAISFGQEGLDLFNKNMKYRFIK